MTNEQIFWLVAAIAVLAFAVAHATATAVHARGLALRLLGELSDYRATPRPTNDRVREMIAKDRASHLADAMNLLEVRLHENESRVREIVAGELTELRQQVQASLASVHDGAAALTDRMTALEFRDNCTARCCHCRGHVPQDIAELWANVNDLAGRHAELKDILYRGYATLCHEIDPPPDAPES